MTTQLGRLRERRGTNRRCKIGHACRNPAAWETDNGTPICSPCAIQAILRKRAYASLEPADPRADAKPERPAAVTPTSKTGLRVIPDVNQPGFCGCGCGGMCKRTFRQGHDMNLKSRRKSEGLDPYTGQPTKETT